MDKYSNTAKQVSNTAKQVANTMKQEYPEINDIKQNVNELKSNTTDLARHVYADGREALSEAGTKAARSFGHIREAGSVELKKLEGRVRENPGQSVLVAFAAGLIASFIFGRK